MNQYLCRLDYVHNIHNSPRPFRTDTNRSDREFGASELTELDRKDQRKRRKTNNTFDMKLYMSFR